MRVDKRLWRAVNRPSGQVWRHGHLEVFVVLADPNSMPYRARNLELGVQTVLMKGNSVARFPTRESAARAAAREWLGAASGLRNALRREPARKSRVPKSLPTG